jgi:hypothetical protein
MRPALRVARALAGLAALTTLGGCDKIGLGRKDADGGTTTTSGGVLAFLDSSFEGDIAMTVKKPSETPKSFTIELKSPKLRVEAPAEIANGQAVSVILDPPAKRATLLNHAKKQAMVIDLDKAKTAHLPGFGGAPTPGAPATPSAPAEKPNIEKTGKKDSVAGYACDIWKITPKDGTHAEACLAEGIKWIDLGDLGIHSPEMAAAAALTDLNHFPLRLVSFDTKNIETSRMEATKIDKKKLDDATFTVPPGYQVVDIGALLQGLGAPGAGASGRPPFPPPRLH